MSLTLIVRFLKNLTKNSRVAKQSPCSQKLNQLRILSSILLIVTFGVSPTLAGTVSSNAYTLIDQRTNAIGKSFLVYFDQDSGFNHGFASGFMGSIFPQGVNAGCIDAPSAPGGCATDVTSLDRTRGTVLQVQYPTLGATDWSGLGFVEPENYLLSQSGTGWNVSGATAILFDARAPQTIRVQFGVGGGGSVATSTTGLVQLTGGAPYKTICIALTGNTSSACNGDTVALSLSPPLSNSALKSAHILLTVVTNASDGGSNHAVLLDKIRYLPTTAAQMTAFGLPLSTQTFGVIPVASPLSGAIPVPPDQVNRNIASIYEASLAILALAARHSASDVTDALRIADALVYAQGHENAGDPLPGRGGLHNAYESGFMALLNSQDSGAQAGQVRLAGFTMANACGEYHYCLVLDGASGGNNAFVILALLKAYKLSGKAKYLNAAIAVGNWIQQQLTAPGNQGYGGYYVGYPDEGATKTVETGKSTENNADIYAAFSALAAVETTLGKKSAAAQWNGWAKIAGDFVIKMYDGSHGCFYAGTAPKGTTGAGIKPTGIMNGPDEINGYDFFDSNSFAYLAMSKSKQYSQAVSWGKVASCLSRFQSSAAASGHTYSGYDIVTQPDSGPNGVAWEFTGQAAVVTKTAGGNPSSILANIAYAQAHAPFADGLGLVAATLDGATSSPPYSPPPYGQCLATPFQCIPERVGLAATVWAIFAETSINPFQ
jgi:hypothetical protein